MKVWALTHTGYRRPQNQDRYLVKDRADGSVLAAVADGMGGQAAGDLAAQIAVNHLAAATEAALGNPAGLAEAFGEACARIYRKAQSEPRLEGMGTTLTAAVVARQSVQWAHVGDSRLYLFTRDGNLDRITTDHTVVSSLVEEGLLSAEEALRHPARHVLLDCLGCGQCQPDAGSFPVQGGDQLLLTTDGLHSQVSQASLARVLSRDGSLQEKVETLLRLALEAGGEDNITVIGLEL